VKYHPLLLISVLSFNNVNGQAGFLGESKTINDSIKIHLEGMYLRTMNPRWDYFKAVDKFGNDSREAKQMERRMVENDSTLLAEVLTIYHRYGWPKLSQVDTIASAWAANQIIHSDTDTQRIFIPIFFKELVNAELLGESWALLVDRYLTLQGVTQIYGTQNIGFSYKDGKRKTIIWPVQNFDKINELRTNLGMKRIDESMKLDGSSYDPEVTIDMVKSHN